MQIQVFSIAMDGDGNSMDELNVFLRTHRVLSVDKVAVMDQGRHYWSVYVEYLARKRAQGGGLASGSGGLSNRPRVDYREELTKPEFERYSLLRDLRKQVAAREAVPVYALDYWLSPGQPMTQKVPGAMLRLSGSTWRRASCLRGRRPRR